MLNHQKQGSFSIIIVMSGQIRVASYNGRSTFGNIDSIHFFYSVKFCQFLVSLKARKGSATDLRHLNYTNFTTANGMPLSPESEKAPDWDIR